VIAKEYNVSGSCAAESGNGVSGEVVVVDGGPETLLETGGFLLVLTATSLLRVATGVNLGLASQDNSCAVAGSRKTR
jgi:hypothetical protein